MTKRVASQRSAQPTSAATARAAIVPASELASHPRGPDSQYQMRINIDLSSYCVYYLHYHAARLALRFTSY
jgi:hypothetical protein